MSLKGKTQLFVMATVIVFFLAWIVYDIYAIVNGGTEASISFVIYEWSYRYPILTFFIGFINGLLVGHFFWKIRGTETTDKIDKFSRGE